MDVEHLREELGVKEMSTDELACVANELNNLGLKEQSNQNQRLDNLLGSTGSVRILWADPGMHERIVVSNTVHRRLRPDVRLTDHVFVAKRKESERVR